MANPKDEQPTKLTKKQLAALMKKMDFCMMTTVGPYGQLESRPMSNNRNVDWDGDTWFFAHHDSNKVKQIGRDNNVSLIYSLPEEFTFIALRGKASIVTSVAKKKELWQDDLERWFHDGPEDENVVLIKVEGQHVTMWGKEGDGELKL